MILKIDPRHPDQEIIERATAVLRKDGFVVAPTETRYGLLARADNQAILEQLYRLKQRDIKRPTALLATDAARLAELGEVTSLAARFIDRFLPGPLTLVLAARHDWLPPRVTEGKIGVRWSDSVVVDQILKLVDFPITATSANISGRSDPTRVEEIEAMLGDGVQVYLDGGALTGPTSTVVDCTGAVPVVLREGAIATNEIESVAASNA